MHEKGGDTVQKKLKYPKSVFFIISNEFCERFAFYGMRTVLTLYLQRILLYSENTSTVIFHIFIMLAYLTPIFGAMLSDSLLGKFKTIFYISIIYAIGQFILSASATPWLNFATREFTMLGLVLVALGTGGIKPCVSAFGGDQFIMPQQEIALTTFFSLFYFAINSGSLISTFITPILREDIKCFGIDSCFSLAFLVPAVLMALSIVIFILGKPLYRIKKPEGNVVLNVSKCIAHAIRRKYKTSSHNKRDHWLDYADDKYSSKMIEDIRSALKVLKLFLPLPIFWALFDQQGSRWTFQANNMNGEIGSYIIKPDQMQVVNPFLIVLFIPIFNSCLYPIFHKLKIFNTPLKKLTLGGVLAAFAFIISSVVEFQMEDTYAILPTAGKGQLRIFNTLNCSVPMSVQNETFELKPLDFWENINIPVNNYTEISIRANFALCHKENFSISSGEENVSFLLHENTAISLPINRNGLYFPYKDSVSKAMEKDFFIRALISLADYDSGVLRLVHDGSTKLTFDIKSEFNETALMEMELGTYDFYWNEKLIEKSIRFRRGGVYTLVGYISENVKIMKILTVTPENGVHILWLIPQYIVITMGEVMFSVTGLEFAFTQAPVSMKSLLQSAWLLTVAIGNLVVIIIAETSFMKQSYEFLLFAGLMFLDMIVFAVMAMCYKYVVITDESEGGEIWINSAPLMTDCFELDDDRAGNETN
ncbi:peptide transporter family 1 isoform X2 [Leptopilina heterotoma]|uniref:peptide transporter family 1 isoform X2 n=1 Tax=Leptopilina heterotoma TaxID=63436 RepID=UPI001CA9688B|nr:peptide transporter family 1 isoform X2 [Leptopilina heterotoma]